VSTTFNCHLEGRPSGEEVQSSHHAWAAEECARRAFNLRPTPDFLDGVRVTVGGPGGVKAFLVRANGTLNFIAEEATCS